MILFVLIRLKPQSLRQEYCQIRQKQTCENLGKNFKAYGRLTSQNLHLVSFFSYNAQKCLELDSEDKRKLLFKESLYHTHTNVPFHQANSQHDQLCPILILTIKQHYDKTPPSFSQTIEWKN